MAKHPSHILELARTGAEHKYEELKSELASLIKHFPHLLEGKASARKVPNFKAGKELAVAPEPTSIRKRSGWSAAAKKAVSLRMKKYWAAKRAATK